MNVVIMAPVGTRELTIRTTLTPADARDMLRECNRVFTLTDFSWDDSGAATLKFVPWNGMAEIVESRE